MHPDVEAEILSAMAENLDRPAVPPPACEQAPAGRDYGDAGTHARELERIFQRRWIPIARVDELPEPGSFRTLDLGTSRVAAVRGADGELQAFHNVCVHRGAQILRQPAGRVESLTCPYHALRYDHGGVLRGLPCAESFPPSLQPGRARLAPIASERWKGWLWIRVSPSGPSLAEALGPELTDELENWPLDPLEARLRREVDADFDWKVGVEAFLEPLHVPAIHGRTAHPVVDFSGMAARRLGEHSRMALPFRSPIAFEPQGVLGSVAAAAGVGVLPGLNAAQRSAHLVYLLFPSTIWMLFPNHALTVDFLPTAPGRCRMLARLLTPPAASEAAESYLASLVPGYEQLLEEDLTNLPWIQRGLQDPSFERCQLSGYERRIPDFWAARAAALADPPLQA